MFSISLQDLRFGLVCIFLLFSITLNSFVFFCLCHLKTSATNQRQILMSLSISQVFYSIMAICKWSLIHVGHNINNSLALQLFFAGVFSNFYVYCLLILVLLLDRFISVAFPFKQSTIFSKIKVRCTNLVSWITGYLLAIPLVVLSTDSWKKYVSIHYVVVEANVMILSIFTFYYIGRTVRKRRSYFKNKGRLEAASTRHPEILKTFLLTILTFLFVIAIPDFAVMILLAFRSISDSTINFIYCMLNLNFVIDPLICLLTYPSMRREFIKAMTKIGFSCFQDNCEGSSVTSVDLIIRHDLVAM